MKIAYAVIVVLHGLIHLMGFVKGFGIKDIKELTLPISKTMALVWLVVAVVTIGYAAMHLLQSKYAWALGFAAALLSQVLVFMYWQDAKFGTVANVLILVVSVFQFGQYRFNTMVHAERENLSHAVEETDTQRVTEADLAELPLPVQQWMRNTGVVGKPIIRHGHVVQQADMKMKPDQKDWLQATATQFTNLQEPTFHWVVNARMNALMGFSGRDQYHDGRGEMLIKLNGLIPVVNETGPKLTEGSAQRYLGELVWFPSMALSPYVTWEAVTVTEARATLTHAGVTASGTFRFNDKGEFVQFSAMRYMENTPEAKRFEWVLDVQGYKTFDGVRIPSEMTATWKLPKGDWTWLRLKLMEVSYDH